MPNTDSLPILTQYLVDKFVANKVLLGLPVSADVINVHYGDQETITFTPCICVEPDSKRRVLNGVRRRTENTFSIGVLIYTGLVTDPQVNRKDADELAEAVETLIHADATFGANPNQLVIHSLVESIESGYARKGGNTVLRSSRLMVSAMSQTILPPNP